MKGVQSGRVLARSGALQQRRWASQYATSKAGSFQVATADDVSGPTSALTVALKAGSRFESKPGAAHCLKNYVFRSTDKRSALRIIREAEIYGGVLSSSLSRENLFITAEFLKGDESYFAEVLGDAVSRLKLMSHEFSEEVAPQSIAEYEAAMHSADAVALDKIHEVAFRRGLGNSLYASPDVSVSHKDATAFAGQALGSANNIAVLASNVDSAALNSLVSEHFSVSGSGSAFVPSETTTYYGGEARLMHHGSHDFLSVAFKAGSLADQSYFVLQHLLGGEPSVKWSQGASVLSTQAPGAKAFYYGYSDAGLVGFNMAGSASDITGVAQKASAAFKKVAAGEISEEDVKRAIANAKFDIASWADQRISSLESSGAQLLSTGSIMSLADAFAGLDKVSVADVTKAASEALKSKPTVVAVGNTRTLPYADTLGL